LLDEPFVVFGPLKALLPQQPNPTYFPARLGAMANVDILRNREENGHIYVRSRTQQMGLLADTLRSDPALFVTKLRFEFVIAR
jgi:hypothetical protein